MTEDPRDIIARSPMSPRQFTAILLCMLLNALDGFDVLSISFASPGIAADWHIDRARLGVVLSMELFGMAIGAIGIGALADRVGRRPTTLLCLGPMVFGMVSAALAPGLLPLSLGRLVTGLGIGGMLVCTNTMTAEYANDRTRNLAIAIMAAGFPLGAIVGGSIVSALLVNGTWRIVFIFGAIATATAIPAAWFLLPESIGYIMTKVASKRLAKVNAALRKLGHRPVDALPVSGEESTPEVGVTDLFRSGLSAVTILLTLAYSAHIMTLYFTLKWIPKIVVDMGYSPASAGGVLVWANVGGLIGGIFLSSLGWFQDVRRLVIGAMIAGVAALIIFGRGQSDLAHLSLAAASVGFCTNGAMAGLYAILARSFPTALRGSGTGFALGAGRGGAALGPVIAGLLFAAGYGLQVVATTMALGSLIAAGGIFALRWTIAGRRTAD